MTDLEIVPPNVVVPDNVNVSVPALLRVTVIELESETLAEELEGLMSFLIVLLPFLRVSFPSMFDTNDSE